jgi:uncharacterized ubiquitin-like protein YukD
MILVDIFVPILGRKYDFRLAADVSIERLILEICETICQRERCQMTTFNNAAIIVDAAIETNDQDAPQKNRMLLCRSNAQQILASNMTLAQCGIQNGEQLFLA